MYVNRYFQHRANFIYRSKVNNQNFLLNILLYSSVSLKFVLLKQNYVSNYKKNL